MRHLESDTIQIPEAAELVGKDVRITVETVEESVSSSEGITNGRGEPYDGKKAVEALDELARAIREGEVGYDFDAYEDLRRRSVL